MKQSSAKQWELQKKDGDEWEWVTTFNDKNIAMHTSKLWIKTHPHHQARLLEFKTTSKEIEIK